MAWTEHPKVMALRRRARIVDIIVESLDGFRRHLTGRNGAVVTYYGFLTLFPLFLAVSTILGFVLENKPEWRDDLLGSAVEQVPFIGESIASGTIDGNWAALVVGLVAALWGSTRAFVGLQLAYDDVWEIDLDDRASFITQRARALIGLAVIGVSQIATVGQASFVAHAGLPRLGQILLTVGGLAINVGVAAAMYRYLTSADTSLAMVWPGALFTGVLYTALQLGGAKVTAALAKDDTYGDFAGVLGLLAWLSLHAIINLFGAELNAALVRMRAPADSAGSEAPNDAEPSLAEA